MFSLTNVALPKHDFFSRVGGGVGGSPQKTGFKIKVYNTQWRNRRGVGGRVPPETSDRQISADLPGKKRQGKKGKGVKIQKKIVKGKVEKLQNEERTFFFFFFFTFQNH